MSTPQFRRTQANMPCLGRSTLIVSLAKSLTPFSHAIILFDLPSSKKEQAQCLIAVPRYSKRR